MKLKDYLAVVTILLILITTVSGMLSINFSHAYDFINQYGHTVSIYGYGIYAFDSYFKAPISIGTDICVLLVLLPMFIYTYFKCRKESNSITELKLVSVYAVVLYYAASYTFGVTYNQLFLVYLVLFSCSLFGMFYHIINIRLNKTFEITKGVKVFLVLTGLALIIAWLPDIIPTIIKGSTLSLIGVYTTEITYILDMGIISPLCFICIYLLANKKPLGTLLFSILLKSCIIVAIMIIFQTIFQVIAGIEIALPVIITKSSSFILLGSFAIYFNRRMYKEIESVYESEK